ncbi:MAG TPA: multicopper oxidase domain-containing protein [Dermatophilaceae bacterium]|nr:multicopper oxidase domain-containing protein [Dermatophilaceae bacterium]
MRIHLHTWASRAAVLAAALVLVAAVVLAAATAATAATTEGLDCDTSSTNSFTLTADDGYVSTPDGNSIYMWSYDNALRARFQLPGPTLCVTSGKAVTVILHNTLPEATSIIFPGQLAVKANGNPAQPQLDSGGSLTSMVQSAPAGNGSVTYTFTAGSPGTYLYRSGTDVDKQVQMGLYGALVVRPVGGADHVNNRADSAFNPAHEYLFLLSEVDPQVHLAVERKSPVDWDAYNAKYFMINGRSMPDTLAPNHASWLPNQPYGAFVHIRPYDASTNPLPATIRYLNAGTVNYPFHPHGSDERVVNKDGQALAGPTGQDLSYNKFDLNVAPGQTLDVLMDWRDVEHWDATTNPVPTQIPAITDQLLVGTDTWFSESPYLGTKNPVPSNITDNNQCGEYYHIAHSHALQQATNFGATFGGMMTVYRIDPPNGCSGN